MPGRSQQLEVLESHGNLTDSQTRIEAQSRTTAVDPAHEPLLRSKSNSPKLHRLSIDRFQLLLVLLIQLAEPITAKVIFPFVNQFVRETGVTGGDERKTGYYAGMIESMFFVTESATVYYWGSASDVYGRKPILLVGLMLLVPSTLGFGLSRAFSTMLIFRSLQGVCNGNIGVTKSVLVESAGTSDSSAIAYLFSLMTITWSTGVTLGPIVGGILARPAERWPSFDTTFWKIYPYVLPCGAAAFVVLITFLIALVCLKESNPAIVKKRVKPHSAEWIDPELEPAAESYGTLNPAPHPSPSPPPERLLTKRTVIPLVNMAFIAFAQQSDAVLTPLVLSTSVEHGGLGMNPYQIGIVLGIWGLANGAVQLLVSHRLIERIGARSAYMLTFTNMIAIFVSFAAIAILVPTRGVDNLVMAILVFYLGLKTITGIAYPCIYVFIVDSATESTLGSINGLGQMVSSIFRALAPAVTSSLYSVSLEKGYLGGTMVYWILIGITIMGIYASTKLPKKLYRS